MSNAWLAYLIRALATIPVLVAGIEQVHGDAKSGASKKQMAMEALGLAGPVAQAIDPAHQEAIGLATQVVSTAIDGTVAVMRAANPGPKVSALVPPGIGLVSIVQDPEPQGTATTATPAPAPAAESGRSVFGS